jgi:hypothetical protein
MVEVKGLQVAGEILSNIVTACMKHDQYQFTTCPLAAVLNLPQ